MYWWTKKDNYKNIKTALLQHKEKASPLSKLKKTMTKKKFSYGSWLSWKKSATTTSTNTENEQQIVPNSTPFNWNSQHCSNIGQQADFLYIHTSELLYDNLEIWYILLEDEHNLLQPEVGICHIETALKYWRGELSSRRKPQWKGRKTFII